MKYNDFIRIFTWRCREKGIKINQTQMKLLFDEFNDFVFEEVSEGNKVPIRGFVMFDKIVVPPKILPNGSKTDEMLSVRVRLSEGWRKRFKEINNK